MHALAGDIEEGALDVDSEHSGDARGDRGAHGGDGACDDFEIGTDQCGEEPGGTETPVRSPDRLDRLDARGIVEEYAAAAIHLGVDESRQKQGTGEVALWGRPAARVGGFE